MIHAVLLKVTGQILTGRPAEGESDSEEDELRPYTRRSLAKHVRSIASRHQYHTHILGPELWVRVHVDYAGLFVQDVPTHDRCAFQRVGGVYVITHNNT